MDKSAKKRWAAELDSRTVADSTVNVSRRTIPIELATECANMNPMTSGAEAAPFEIASPIPKYAAVWMSGQIDKIKGL